MNEATERAKMYRKCQFCGYKTPNSVCPVCGHTTDLFCEKCDGRLQIIEYGILYCSHCDNEEHP